MSIISDIKLYYSYKKNLNEIKDELFSKFNVKVDNADRMYTVLNLPEDVFEEPYNLRKADIDTISEQMLREYISALSGFLDSKGLREMYKYYDPDGETGVGQIKKVDKYSYLIVIGFKNINSVEYNTLLWRRILPGGIIASIITALIFYCEKPTNIHIISIKRKLILLMSKFYEVDESTKDIFNSVFEKKAFPVNVRFQFLGSEKQKELIKIAKLNDQYAFLLDKEILVIINEDLLTVFDDELVDILIEQEIDKISINSQSGKIKMVRPDLSTFSSIINKYGVEKVARANQVEDLYQQQVKDGTTEELSF